MIYHVCQVWGDNWLTAVEVFGSRDEVEAYLLQAREQGILRLLGEVVVVEGVEKKGGARYTPQQFMRSRRVKEVIDALSPAWRRPTYEHEYVRSVFEKGDRTLPRYDHAPDTLTTDAWPQDLHDPPRGPDWHLRARIRPWRESLTSDERESQRAEIAAARLAQPREDELALKRAIASLARRLEARQSPLVEDQAPSVKAQLDALGPDPADRHPRSGHLPNQGYVDTSY